MVEWSNQIGSRGREAWLLLVGPGDRVTRFRGASIPAVAAVTGSGFRKNGKWSSTTYRITLATGVRPVAGRDGWETGRLDEGLAAASGRPCDRWLDAAAALGVGLPTLQAFVAAEWPQQAELWDEREEALATIDDAAAEGAEELTTTFGCPTKRLIAAGFWERPCQIVSADGALVATVAPDEAQYGWPHCASDSPLVRVVKCDRARGGGGGTVTLTVAAPAGCRLVHGDGE